MPYTTISRVKACEKRPHVVIISLNIFSKFPSHCIITDSSYSLLNEHNIIVSIIKVLAFVIP